MFRSIRNRLTYANVAMTLALVFAMTGGAYAAGKYLITSTKQINPKVLRQLKGARGPAGERGPQGAPGERGAAGANGKDGTNGASGKDGVGVTGSAEPAGSNCKAGGSKFMSASGATYACNGENGQTGFTATLPKEQTEKGTWAYSIVVEADVAQQVPISFPIPLSKELEGSQVHYILANGKEWDFATQAEATSPSTACLGSVADPKAVKGNLCVYAAALGPNFEALQVPAPERIANPSGAIPDEGAGKSGALLQFVLSNSKLGYGTWAVTEE